MTWRTGHGRGRGTPHVEVSPVDELPVGIAAPKPTAGAMARPPYATGSPEAREAGRRGGKAKAGKTRLADRLGLRALPEGSTFAPYKASAVSFRRAQCSALSASVGGGYCGPGPSSFVASAALQLAWSRYFSDVAAETGDPQLALTASRLADASRQNLLAAHELCAREAVDRKKQEQPMTPEQLAEALEKQQPKSLPEGKP